jgi:hypothetical protein
MPNWCVNQVDIVGDEAEVARLVDFVKGDNTEDNGNNFSFEKIVPPPSGEIYSANETQNDFQCGCKKEWITTKEAVGEPMTEGFVPHEGYWAVNGVAVEKQVLGNDTIKDFVGASFGGVEICPEHKTPQISSHPDWWYNWNVNNWGTKWSAREVWHDRSDDSNAVVEGKTSYGFDTAWSPAEPVVLALSALFPTLTITHRYCEGGMCYAGEAMYRGGDEVSRQEYSGEGDNLPDEAWFTDEDGERSYERDYAKVPMTSFEKFCDEHFGGVVGG